MTFKAIRSVAIAGLLSAAIAAPMVAQAAMSGDEAIAKRQEIMKLNGKTLKEAGGLSGDAAVAAGQTFVDNFAAVGAADLWTEDSSMSPDTKALPAVWENPEDFQTKMMAASTAAAKVLAAAQSGDEAAYKASLMELGGTCKSCHETYKAPN